MSRLYDRLMQWDILGPLPNRDNVFDPANVAWFTRKCRSAIQDAVVVESTNVAEQFIDTYVTDTDPKRNLLRDLKCLCPPFAKTFFEWSRLPHYLADAGAQRAGLCVYGTTKDEAPVVFQSVFGQVSNSRAPKEMARMAEHPDCHWILVGWDFIQFRSRPDQVSPLRGPYNTFAISVDKEGRYLDMYIGFATSAISRRESEQVAASSMIGFLALAMMNCRNVNTRDHDPNQQRRRRKRRRRAQPAELVSFKTIHVDTSVKAPTAASRPTGSNGQPKRRGPVRGHMKRYEGAGLLFGKYRGTWYWGPHLRGDAKAGVTVADYAIDTDKKK